MSRISERPGTSPEAGYGSLSKPSSETLDAGSSRNVLAFLFAASLVEGMDAQLLPASFRALEQDLGLSPSQLGLLSFCQGFAMAIFGPCWGCLADHGVPRKWLLGTGTASWGVLTLVLARVDEFWPMVGLRFLNGVALGMLNPVAQSLIADVAHPGELGRLFGIANCISGMGAVSMAVIATSISTRLIYGFDGWRVAFAVVGVLSLTLSLFTFFFMREQRRPWRLGEASLLGELRGLIGYWHMHTFKIIVLQGVFGTIPWAALAFITMYLQYAGLSDLKAALLVAAFMLAGAVGQLLAGWVGDSLARWSPWHGRPLTAQISVTAGIPIVFLLFVAVPRDSAWWGYFLALLVALGLLASWCHSGVNAPILVEIVPHNRATVMAWLTAICSSAGSFAGAPAVGYFSQTIYGYEPYRGSVASMPPATRLENAQALASTLVWCTVIPWSICLAFYSLLHVTYPADAKAAQRAEAEAQFCDVARGLTVGGPDRHIDS